MTRRWMAVFLLVALVPVLAAARSLDQRLIATVKNGNTAGVQALLARRANANARD